MEINSLSSEHECAIFLLNFKDFKTKVKDCTKSCLDTMKARIPQILSSSASQLKESLMEAVKQVESKPTGVESYMVFQFHKGKIIQNIEIYADELAEINCVWIIMKNGASTNSEMSAVKRQEKDVNDIQMLLTQLRNQIEESEMNNKTLETRAQEETKAMLPKLR